MEWDLCLVGYEEEVYPCVFLICLTWPRKEVGRFLDLDIMPLSN